MDTVGGIFQKLYHPSMKSYLLLVLVPQLLWVLSNPNGLSAVCESCSDLSYHQLLLMQPPIAAGRVSRNDKTITESASDLQADRNCASDGHIMQRGGRNSDSFQAYTYSDLNVSSLCMCSLEHSPSKGGYTGDKWREESSGNKMDGGWHIPHNLPNLAGPCNIQRRNSSLSQQDFLEKFAYTEPVILTGLSDQSLLRILTSKYRLLRTYGQDLITVATANTQSYHRVKMSLCEYIDRVMKPQTLYSLGNETLYHFGDNDREGWAKLFSLYRLPPYNLPGLQPVLSFGLAGIVGGHYFTGWNGPLRNSYQQGSQQQGYQHVELIDLYPVINMFVEIRHCNHGQLVYISDHLLVFRGLWRYAPLAYDPPGIALGPGTGVPFHIHGPTFAETIYGKKRWFLYPPDHRPTFHPDITTLHWVTFTLPHLPRDQQPMECTLQPGEVLYFPDRWWHATLNVDTAVFVSTFYS